MNPKLIIEQKITAFVNQYRIYNADAEGQKSNLVAFVQQKRLTFKEHVTFYADEQKTKELFRFRAEKAMDIHGRYFVEDAEGNTIGAFKKSFKKSLLNSTWHILKDDEPTLVISESNKVLAVARRFLEFIPIIGDFAEFVLPFLRYHFTFANAKTNEEVGKYKKITLFRDHYVLSMTNTSYEAQDWRVLAAMSVALGALQSR